MTLSAVSVAAASATQADPWSTAIVVGGPRLTHHVLARREVQRVWLVNKQGRARWLL